MVRLPLIFTPRLYDKSATQTPTRLLGTLSIASDLWSDDARRRLRLLLSLMTFCGICCPPSHASLIVREDARHAEQWFRLYEELPGVWKTRRAIKLRELPPRDMERLIAKLEGGDVDRHDDSVVDGCYQEGEDDEETPIITLCDNLRGEQASLVFTHEYGHFVWDAILTNSERGRYARLWRTQKRAHHLVTEYASDSEEEGFAEAFAYFLRKPSQLQRRDQVSSQFFRDLFVGRETGSSGLRHLDP